MRVGFGRGSPSSSSPGYRRARLHAWSDASIAASPCHRFPHAAPTVGLTPDRYSDPDLEPMRGDEARIRLV